MPTYLSLDLGEKRIGVAISDEMGMIASPLKTIDFKDRPTLLKNLRSIIEEYQVQTIVVGHPLTMEGEVGRAAQSAQDKVEWFKTQIDCQWILWDERLTTVEAEQVLLEADMSRAKRQTVRDSIAAQRILQSYLDSRN